MVHTIPFKLANLPPLPPPFDKFHEQNYKFAIMYLKQTLMVDGQHCKINKQMNKFKAQTTKINIDQFDPNLSKHLWNTTYTTNAHITQVLFVSPNTWATTPHKTYSSSQIYTNPTAHCAMKMTRLHGHTYYSYVKTNSLLDS